VADPRELHAQVGTASRSGDSGTRRRATPAGLVSEALDELRRKLAECGAFDDGAEPAREPSSLLVQEGGQESRR
jgi:hypothetical protein